MAKTEKPPQKKHGLNGGARPGAGRPAFKPTGANGAPLEFAKIERDQAHWTWWVAWTLIAILHLIKAADP